MWGTWHKGPDGACCSGHASLLPHLPMDLDEQIFLGMSFSGDPVVFKLRSHLGCRASDVLKTTKIVRNVFESPRVSQRWLETR